MHAINRVLGENTISYSTVGKCVPMFSLSTKETNASVVSESDSDFSLDDCIALVLSGEPFLLVRQIAKKVTMSQSAVLRHVTQAMRWKLRHVKWTAHGLTESGKMNRVQKATEFLEDLQSIRHHGWQCIITLDRSWLFREIDCEQ
jgi:hypothetical protein